MEMQKGTVSLAGKEVPYTVRISGRAKNISLRVGIGTGLEVVTPREISAEDLGSILRRKQKWILGKLGDVERAADRRPPANNCSRVLYRGLVHRLEIRSVDEGPDPFVAVENGKITVAVPGGAAGNAGRVLEQWLRNTARAVIGRRLREISEKINLSYKRVSVRGQKTRWGSCSPKGNLNFNWRLVMAPPPVLDYVIIHELMHLLEPNHSKKFWSLVEKECPEYKAHRAWLRKNGPLMFFCMDRKMDCN